MSFFSEIDPVNCYEFSQTSNPVTNAGAVTGFVLHSGPNPTSGLGGLHNDSPHCMCNGDPGGTWWWAVGQIHPFNGKCPGPGGGTYEAIYLYAVA